MLSISTKENIDGIYSKVASLGMGSYGDVYLYERTQPLKSTPFNDFFLSWRKAQSQYFALKVYRKPGGDSRQGADFSSLRQITLLQTLNHPNVAACHDVIYQRTSQSRHLVYVVLDFHLQLADLLREPSTFNGEEGRSVICLQIVKGLAFLHENYIFHRDLKPQNIFVSRSGRIKLADFGFAKEFGTPHKKYTMNTCTMQYRAPEVFLGTHYYTEKSDIWALGCIIAYIYTGRNLFICESTGTQIELIGRIFYLRGTPTEDNWPSCHKFPRFYQFDKLEPKDLASELKLPRDVVQIIDMCLQLDPRKRPSAQQLLEMEFFKRVEDVPFKTQQIFQNKLKKILDISMQ